MVERMQARLRPTGESHRVTTLELLFDLVFVYAITNVTTVVEHDLTRYGVLDGVVTLAVVWFGWCSYAWLGDQSQADEGVTRLAVIVAMGAMFSVAISIPHAFEDGANAATVLVVAYAVVRSTRWQLPSAAHFAERFGIPALASASSLVQVVAPAVALVALVIWEVWAFRDARDDIRHAEAAAQEAAE